MNKKIFCFLFCLVFVSCATPGLVRGNIESYHNLESYSGKTLYLDSYAEVSRNDLSFSFVREKFEERLSNEGYKITQSSRNADLIVYIGYSVGDEETKVGTRTIPTFGTFGEITGSRQAVDVYSERTRLIGMEMYDAVTEKQVYSMVLQSKGSCGALREVLDEFLNAIFTNFPNNNGRFTKPGIFSCWFETMKLIFFLTLSILSLFSFSNDPSEEIFNNIYKICNVPISPEMVKETSAYCKCYANDVLEYFSIEEIDNLDKKGIDSASEKLLERITSKCISRAFG